MAKNFPNPHTRSESERQLHTVSHTSSSQRRLSADYPNQLGHADGTSSRPIPLPRKNQTSMYLPSPADHIPEDLIAAQSHWHMSRTPGQQQQSQPNEMDRLLTNVEELRREERRLGSSLSMLHQREEAVKQRELDLIERERDWSLKEARREGEYKDQSFELSQKRRELQLLEDQLHMKNKDLKQREFDLWNADGPSDISSSKMADLADRHYELDKREEALGLREQSLQEWSRKLSEEDQAMKKRLHDLQQMETHFQTPTSPPVQGHPPGGLLCRPHQPWTNPHAPCARSSRPLCAEPTGGFSSNWIPPSKVPDEPFRRMGTEAAAVSPSTQRNRTFVQQPPLPPSPPQDEPISMMGHTLPAPRQHGVDQFSKDMQLAWQLEEDKMFEENQLKINIANDLLVALSLQQEDLTDEESLTHMNQLCAEAESDITASVIKKELDTRLTQEQIRQKQEREDFIFAQNLVSERNNSESDDQSHF